MSYIYKVEPLVDLPYLAYFRIALLSAWSTWGRVYKLPSIFLTSHLFSNPQGVPLNPSDIIWLSLTIIAPTLSLIA